MAQRVVWDLMDIENLSSEALWQLYHAGWAIQAHRGSLFRLPVSPFPLNPVILDPGDTREARALLQVGLLASAEMAWALYKISTGYLYVLPQQRGQLVVGACFFCRAATSGWHMAAVWIAPGYQRQGLFTASWPKLKQAFGEFAILGPLSPAFQQLCEKHRHVKAVVR